MAVIEPGLTTMCAPCKRVIPWDEYIANCGMCDFCFNEMCELYFWEKYGSHTVQGLTDGD